MNGSKVNEIVKCLKAGKPIILVDENNQGKIISLVEKVTSNDINLMITFARGLVSVGIEESRAQQLSLSLHDRQNTDKWSQAYTISIDYEGTTTGISAIERCDTIRELINPKRKAEDFKRPGHIFPVVANRLGIFGKQSHVEAGIELAKMANSYPAVVLCDLLNDEGQLANLEEIEEFSHSLQISILNIEELVQYYLVNELFLERKSIKKVKNHIGEFEFISFSTPFLTGDYHVLVSEFTNMKESTPVYIHQSCNDCEFRTCDCNLNLECAMGKIQDFGGVIVYAQHKNEVMFSANEQAHYIMHMLRNVGVEKFHLLHDYNLNPSLIKAYELNKTCDAITNLTA